MCVFFVCEPFYLELETVVHNLADSLKRLGSAPKSTAAAIVMAVVLVGATHLRFARAELNLSQEKPQSEILFQAIMAE